MTDNKKRLLSSTTAFVLAGMIAVQLHEMAHLAAALILGRSATLYPNGVDTGAGVSDSHALIISGAGPIFSLLFGYFIITASKKWGSGFSKLFYLWLGFLSAQIGFGYFIIAPFVKVGDTGKVLALVSAPVVVYIIVFAIGAAGQVWLAKLFGARIAEYSSNEPSSRTLGLYAWIAGTVILLAVYAVASRSLPTEVIPSVLAGIATIGIFISMLTIFTKHHRYLDKQLNIPATPYATVGLTTLLAVLMIVFMSKGIVIG